MAKEYIEREALIEELEKVPAHFNSGDVRWGVKIATTLVAKHLTADVVEVKHGEWKQGHYEGGVFDGTNFDECSICGYQRLLEDVELKTQYKYCPNCGTKMDRKDE